MGLKFWDKLKIDQTSMEALEQLLATVEEMKKFPRDSAGYATLKSHGAELLDKFLDEAPDDLVEALYRCMKGIKR